MSIGVVADGGGIADTIGHNDYWPYDWLSNCLDEFREIYLPIHGWISVIVCLFGIIANILNITVLTRKEMISPTNAILTGLAVADMLVMTTYLPFSIHNFISYGLTDSEKYSKGWAVFTLIHAHSSIVSHTISIWLTVILAVWRYVSVSFPTDSKQWCNMSRAKCVIFFIYIACPIFCIPNYLTFTINRHQYNNTITYKVGLSELAKSVNWPTEDSSLVKINFWMYSVITKLIPCIALTYLSLALVRVLYRANQRKQRLKHHHHHNHQGIGGGVGINYNSVSTGTTTTNTTGGSNNVVHPALVVSNSQHCDRTTRMLLAILLMFLITEFPSGLVALLAGILGDKFQYAVYHKVGELMDLLALINSAINFILYCTMSRQFRVTFAKLFCTSTTTTMTTNDQTMAGGGGGAYNANNQSTMIAGAVTNNNISTTAATGACHQAKHQQQQHRHQHKQQQRRDSVDPYTCNTTCV
ncbi:G-protein coupled receptor dmsr-1-like [Oppia nitens]|uniref:G-protein coupled receptor dmsr-1-like n=1 Tax=Oppia nitens TaxID=1686743 RepID=UPI0023DA21B4|nr:G-protein coupled receptor dmsr-1-like [Oppia nitens]